MASKPRLVIGCVEPVDIPSFGLFGLEARVDTGALTSATFAPIASGVELYAVALDDVFSIAPAASAPAAYVIP